MEDGNNDLIEIELATIPTDGPRVQEGEIYRVLDETSNASILKHSQADYLPCLRDVYLKRMQTGNLSKRNSTVLDYGVVQRIGLRPELCRGGLVLAQSQRQLFPSLPDRTSQSRHVYLVTKPHRNVGVSPFHWSVYSQGYFYHLSARSPKNPTVQSAFWGLRNQAPGACVVLKIEDLSTADSADYMKATTETSTKAFIAYEMGSTQYDPEQLQTLAQWIITRLGTYNLYSADCQVCALSLVYGAVMPARDCSAFVGNKTQLVHWDLRARHNDGFDRVARNPYDIEHGYLVTKPRTRRGYFRTRYPFFVLFFVSESKLHAIDRLYKYGPSISFVVKMDPAGKYNLTIYRFVQCKRIFRYQGQWGPQVEWDLGEGLIPRRWGNAFRGRTGS